MVSHRMTSAGEAICARRPAPHPPDDRSGRLREHSRPRTSHGYCADDVARGLLVICREPDPSPDLLRLAERYLAFLMEAQASFRNRLGPDRRWQDEPAVGDWWGRTLWGLGTTSLIPPTGR
nr:hypothetical protein GCM10020063_043180 [Dactylosporangium thailandense]